MLDRMLTPGGLPLEGIEVVVADAPLMSMEVEVQVEPAHDENLADHIDEDELATIANDLVSDFEADKQSRSEWEETLRKGMDLLGLKIEERTTPWPKACGVFHPLLSEAVVRFQSTAVMETFPAKGPVKAKVIGTMTPEKEKQAERVQDDLNYLLTEKMPEFRSEHERLLFALPVSGAAFKKVYFDPTQGRPVSMFVPAEDFVVAYGASDLRSCQRYTHIMRKPANEVRRLQVMGFYKDVELPEPAPDYSELQQKKDSLTGDSPSIEVDDRHTLLEMHVYLDIAGFEDRDAAGEPTGIALPYVVTIDKQSRQVLSVYRNWDREDPLKTKRLHFVQYSYIPGWGFYAFGLVHLIGGLAKSATSLLRQLVDAGTLSNLPAGLKTRGLRIKGDNTPLQPGEFRDVDVPGGAIRDNIYPLPFKEPSPVLASLLDGIVTEGRRFASIADTKIGEGNQEAPVGTTLALLERDMKVTSAIQARLHASLRDEFRLIARVVRDHMPGAYEYETHPGASRGQDYDGRVDVIPVSDPNAASMAQRVLQYQAAIQLAAAAPQLYDMPTLHKRMLAVLGIPDPDSLVQAGKEVLPMDPMSENMAILTLKPVRASIEQDHKAHIMAHQAMANDPQITAMIGQNPNAQMIGASLAAHMAEHLAFLYRQEVEQKLGAPLPPPGEVLPPEIEVTLSRLVADAMQKVTQQNQAAAMQQQAMQQMQDPIVQAQQAELQIKAADLQRKAQEDQVEAQIQAQRLQVERERIASQERIALAGMQAKARSDAMKGFRRG